MPKNFGRSRRSESRLMLRCSMLLMLLWALLAGPAFAGYLASAELACPHASMGANAAGAAGAGDCGGDGGFVAHACTMHCGTSVGIVGAAPRPQPRSALQTPVVQPSLSAGERAIPPDIAPPKA